MKKIFKQLHLWLSIPIGMVVSVTCFTGAVLIFEPEISERAHRDYLYVAEVGAEALPIDELLARVEPTLAEGQEIRGITIFDDAERSYKVNLSQPKHGATYVDQYSGEVLGQPERLGFFRTMFRLHRWLMDSNPGDGSIFWGKMIVGISTLLMVIIILTGVVIWLPKHLKSLGARLKIKVRSGRHRLLYDLHVAGGFYATALLLVMALTGLTWSFSWYRDGLYSVLGIEQTKSSKPTNSPTDSKARRDSRTTDTTPYAYWQEAYEQIASANTEAEQITISKGAATVKSGGWGNQRAADRYTFDNATGEIVGVELYSDSTKANKARGWIYSLHVGNFGGMVTRIMWFLAAMLGATLPLTGYYLWIRRMVVKRRAKAKIRG
ncbi:MAG: PepSY domain-containing protein [Alistipes sp.]|nr:PepSY domain-containing protein [Alistipes sp.]